MRKLKLQVQMTVDGFVAKPNGELDWMTWEWDDELKKYVIELTDTVDCILIGRKLAEGFIPHWASIASDPGNPEFSFGKNLNDMLKVVFSKTLTSSEWTNTKLTKEDFIEEINKLKKQDGKDIIVYGGAGFVSSLIQAGLIDEFHLFVNPAAIGEGMSIFKNLDKKQNLQLVKSIPFSCGIVLLCYKPTLR